MARSRKNPVQETGRRRTIWHLEKKGEPNGGVRSTIPNCGYDEDELKSIQSKGYRMRTEEVAE